MERGALAGGHVWCGRAKPRPPVSLRMVSPQVVARKNAPGPLAMSQSSEDQDWQAEEEEEEEEEAEEEEEEEAEEEEEEEEEEADISQQGQRTGEKRSPEEEMRMQRVHVPAEAARKRPMEQLHRLSALGYFDEEIACDLRLKMQRFLEAGTSLVEGIEQLRQIRAGLVKKIEGVPGPGVGAAIRDVAQEIVSKSFQQSERLVTALFQFQSDTGEKESYVSTGAILPEQMKVGEADTPVAKKCRLEAPTNKSRCIDNLPWFQDS